MFGFSKNMASHAAAILVCRIMPSLRSESETEKRPGGSALSRRVFAFAVKRIFLLLRYFE